GTPRLSGGAGFWGAGGCCGRPAGGVGAGSGVSPGPCPWRRRATSAGANARYRRAARVGNPDAPAGQRHRTRLATTRDALDDATCGRVDAKETARVVVRNPERRALERH